MSSPFGTNLRAREKIRRKERCVFEAENQAYLFPARWGFAGIHPVENTVGRWQGFVRSLEAGK